MLINDFRKKCYEVQNYWGDKMPMMVMEEAGELIQAISKFERKMSEENLQNLIDEIGDMYISLMALTLQNMDLNDNPIDFAIDYDEGSSKWTLTYDP